MSRIDFGPAQRRRHQAYANTALRPIHGQLLDQRPKALLISTGLRIVWVPRKLVTHDPEKAVFTMPAWLAEEKRLD